MLPKTPNAISSTGQAKTCGWKSDPSDGAMSRFVRTLATVAKRHPATAALVRKFIFLKELFAHRKLIRPYVSSRRHTERDHIVDSPLLIGYFETDFGLGEYARGLASALNTVGLPFSIYPYNSFTGRPRNEAPWASRYDVERVHSVNILCVAPDEATRARRIIGRGHTKNSYNILSTFWELPHAPETWRTALEFFDELWTPNNFVAESFRPIFSKTISVIPPCVNLEIDPPTNRKQFNLDPAKFYFLYSFDLNSYPERKNPLAVAKAFEIAFGNTRDDVGLIFKINGSANLFPKIMSELEVIAKNNARITFFHGDWPRTDVLALLASIDCYVSLHRSEGFGLGMAESMHLGKPVIGTAFSGNADFLTAETGFPIPFTMRSVEEGEYPFHTGNLWAEPDIKVAAETMRFVASRANEVQDKALQGQAYIRQRYGPKAVGGLVAVRLRELPAISPLRSK
jgi:glycosyltransferase involved in cell wall biosynthesis